jgi:hypothetical protein
VTPVYRQIDSIPETTLSYSGEGGQLKRVNPSKSRDLFLFTITVGLYCVYEEGENRRRDIAHTLLYTNDFGYVNLEMKSIVAR